MSGLRAEHMATWCGGRWLRGAPDTTFSGVSIDSRSLAAGELFVAIVGPHHDGHDHVLAAAARGAAGAVVRQGFALPDGLPQGFCAIAVDDTTRALGALASGHRAEYRGPLVAITGSNGKTTTKEMCAAILGVRRPCLKTEGNLNNEYGLPLTLLRRREQHASVVVELGMNHRGEIARLAAIARPSVGVLTNVGTAHIEHLGSREAIAQEKGDLVAALPQDGVAVLNADDPLASAQAFRTRARVLRFGLREDADVYAADVRERATGYAFRLRSPQGDAQVEVTGLAETSVQNALAAACAALAAGAPLSDLAPGLAAYAPVRGRLQPLALDGDVLVVDDTYNANPQSMEVALRALAQPRGESGVRRIAVLGDMGEQGAASRGAHRDAGALAARLGIDLLFAVGSHAGEVAEAARAGGLQSACIHTLSDAERAADAVVAVLLPRDRVLVKGSRSMRMERVVDRIAQARGGRRAAAAGDSHG
jgi:UDP-N-acetylmuramoyl-tripeptide--D-alanyl-D-alanine ligase